MPNTVKTYSKGMCKCLKRNGRKNWIFLTIVVPNLDSKIIEEIFLETEVILRATLLFENFHKKFTPIDATVSCYSCLKSPSLHKFVSSL